MTYQPTDKEQATVDQLKKIGATLRASNPEHKSKLRAELTAPKPIHIQTAPKQWRWLLVPASGAMAVFLFMFVVNNIAQPQMIYEYDVILPELITTDSSDITLSATSLSNEAGLSLLRIPSRPWNSNTTKKEIAEYQDIYGMGLEEYRQIRILTKDLDDKTQVLDLFTLYKGSVNQVNDTSNRFRIVGTIPKKDIQKFQDRLENLATHEKYFEIYGTGKSRTAELMTAPTDKARQKIQDKIDYVDVIVTLEPLPALWTTNPKDIAKVISGFNKPSLFQYVLIILTFTVSATVIIFTATFWLLIPLGYWIWKRKKAQSMLRFLD